VAHHVVGLLYVVLDVGTSIKWIRQQVPGTEGAAGLAGVVGVGNARLFNQAHECDGGGGGGDGVYV